jgi:hypothetical protein
MPSRKEKAARGSGRQGDAVVWRSRGKSIPRRCVLLTARREGWAADAREVPLVFRADAVAEVRQIVRRADGDSSRCEVVLGYPDGRLERLHATASAAMVRSLVASALAEAAP